MLSAHFNKMLCLAAFLFETVNVEHLDKNYLPMLRMCLQPLWMQQAESTGPPDINMSLVICFDFTRGSPADALEFTGQLVEMVITQQSRTALILKGSPNSGIRLHTQVH